MKVGPEIIYTHKPIINLLGQITSPYLISQLSVNKERIFIELAEKEFKLEKKLSLTSGENTISLLASDLAGNQREWQQAVVVDLKGPSISFAPSTEEPNEVTIVIIDHSAIQSVSIDGKIIEFPKPKKVYRQKLLLKPNRKIKIEAFDKVKNRTILDSVTGNLLKASIQSHKYFPDTRLASANIEPQSRRTGSLRSYPSRSSGSNKIKNRESVSDFQLAAKPVFPSKEPDTLAPRLKLFPDVIDRTTVTSEVFFLDVQVSDSGYIDSVTFVLNEQQETRNLHDYKFVKHRFTESLELKPNMNKLRLIVRDWAGNEKSREFIIERKMDFTWREDLRISAQVLPPNTADIRHLDTVDLYSMFLHALLQMPRRLNIVERDPQVIQRLLMELKLSESKLGDLLKAIRVGKLTPSDWLLQGYIKQWSGKENWDLVVNIIDVETSDYILTTDIHFSEFAVPHIEEQLMGLTEKLNQQLPKLSAAVSSSANKGIMIPSGNSTSSKNICVSYF